MCRSPWSRLPYSEGQTQRRFQNGHIQVAELSKENARKSKANESGTVILSLSTTLTDSHNGILESSFQSNSVAMCFSQLRPSCHTRQCFRDLRFTFSFPQGSPDVHVNLFTWCHANFSSMHWSPLYLHISESFWTYQKIPKWCSEFLQILHTTSPLVNVLGKEEADMDKRLFTNLQILFESHH